MEIAVCWGAHSALGATAGRFDVAVAAAVTRRATRACGGIHHYIGVPRAATDRLAARRSAAPQYGLQRRPHSQAVWKPASSKSTGDRRNRATSSRQIVPLGGRMRRATQCPARRQRRNRMVARSPTAPRARSPESVRVGGPVRVAGRKAVEVRAEAGRNRRAHFAAATSCEGPTDAGASRAAASVSVVCPILGHGMSHFGTRGFLPSIKINDLRLARNVQRHDGMFSRVTGEFSAWRQTRGALA
jgi:hypothetical protein